MTRPRRIIEPGALVHAIWRVVNGEFRIDTQLIRERYCRYLERQFGRTGWALLAFAIMSNHIHLALIAAATPFRHLVQPIHCGFAAWLNVAQGRRGPVFADRPKTLRMEPSAALRLISYIHNNPLRADGCDVRERTLWTSHRFYEPGASTPPWMDVELGLRLSGFGSGVEARTAFCEHVDSVRQRPRDSALEADELNRLGVEMRRECGSAVQIDYPRLISPNQLVSQPQLATDGTPMPRWPGSLLDLSSLVCATLGIRFENLYSRDRSRNTARARRIIVLAGRQLNIPTADLAAHLAVDRSTASKYATTNRPADRVLASEIVAQVLSMPPADAAISGLT